MNKHIVCLTFDFDAISGFIARGQTSATWISRGEFGPRVGAPRLLALFKKYGIQTSWYVPGHTIETFPDAVKAVVDAGHEIAHHGWTHRPPASLTREEEEAELVRGNEAIKRISGQYARGYRSPSWDLSPHSVALMLKHGFRYDTSMMGDDYTIADIAIVGMVRNFINFYEAGDLVGYDSFTNVKAWFDRMLARPAVQRGLTIPAKPTAK